MVDSWMRSRQSLDEMLSFFRIGRGGRGLGAAPKLATFGRSPTAVRLPGMFFPRHPSDESPLIFTGLLRQPRVDKRNARRFEIRDVARHDGQAMNPRSRSDQRVAFGPLVRHVKACTSLRHDCIDRKHAPLKPTGNLMVDPGAQAGALRAVLPRNQQCAKLDFENRDRGEEEARRWARSPRRQRCGRPCPVVAVRK